MFTHLGTPCPEATFEVLLAARGGPKVKQLRFGAILTKVVGQQHTVIGSKSEFLNKFETFGHPSRRRLPEVLLAAGGPNNKKTHSGVYHFVV